MVFAFIVMVDAQLSSQVNIWASIPLKEGDGKIERA